MISHYLAPINMGNSPVEWLGRDKIQSSTTTINYEDSFHLSQDKMRYNLGLIILNVPIFYVFLKMQLPFSLKN